MSYENKPIAPVDPVERVVPDSEHVNALGRLANMGLVQEDLTLTPEQLDRVASLQKAMMAEFSNLRHPLSPEDFGLINVGEGKEQKTVFMITKPISPTIRASKYKDAKAERWPNFIKVEGGKVNVIKAMTWDVYKAFIEQAAANGIDPLPDSPELGINSSATWLTGERVRDGQAAYAYVQNGRAHLSLVDKDEYDVFHEYRSNVYPVCIRPAVVI